MKRSRTSTDLTDRLAALSEPVRLRVCRLLEREELSVGEISKIVQMPQSTVSRHLKLPTEAGWTTKRSEGTATLYRLTMDDLPERWRKVWSAVREQVEDDPHASDDDHRLRAVLAERTPDSLSYFGRLAGDWDHVRRELFGSEFTGRALLALLPEEWRVADFGSGTGNAAEMLAPFVREVTLVDLSEPMLAAARERLGENGTLRYVCAGVEETGLAEGSFDAATCVLVLHHLDEPVGAVREMARVVRPGGKVLVVEMVAHDRVEYRHTMGHRRLGFGAEELEGMFAEAGLESRSVGRLPSAPEARGPDLLVGVARRPD